MIDFEDISRALQNFQFASYGKAVSTLLSAYGVAETTIIKIISKIEKGESGPLYVYRRAVLFCNDDENYQPTINSVSGAIPLVIIFQPDRLVISNTTQGEVCCQYDKITEHLDLLAPLLYAQTRHKDQYCTLELDALVESLYRTLILDNNSKEDSRVFIFSLLYIAHFKSILNLSEITQYVNGYVPSEKKKLANVFKFFKDAKCPFINHGYESLTLSKEAYSYIFPIIKFDTTTIDTEILTSLLYRMIDSEEAGLYGHQTSFVNVEKVLRPLLFNEIDAEIASANESELDSIIDKIYEIKIFDPTNGPGCFLVASYNGLLNRLREIETRFGRNCTTPLHVDNFIALTNNNLSKELSILAITFAHTLELSRVGSASFAAINSILPSIKIHIGNELSEDWNKYVVPTKLLRIVGSPQFKGANKLTVPQKEEMQRIFDSSTLHSADFCSSWLVKAAKFIKGSGCQAAFVLTNSVSQGSQASFILDKVNEAGCEYSFGYRSFKWKTTKSDNVGVTVIIIGIANKGYISRKTIYDSNAIVPCKEIGPNLLPDINIRIKSRTRTLSPNLPEMKKGNMSYCADALIFKTDELNDFLSKYPEAKRYVRPLYGSDEFVSSTPRWCLWITDKVLSEAKQIDGISARIEDVRIARANTTATKRCKENPHKFRDTNETSQGNVSLIIPCVTSERRLYFQMGIVDDKTIVNNLACVVYDCDIWLLALLESRMHTVWAKNAAGGHETRPRYSCDLCYNTFPAPEIDKHQQSILRNLAKTLLEVREKYCDKSLGEMYTNMPPELARVHSWIDATVDSLYRSQPFENDAERLIWLKNMYNNLLENE